METKLTRDGSKTVFSPLFNQNYHSFHGAKQESDRVYIELGLEHCSKTKTHIYLLEIGFGTGLNAHLSAEFASKNNILVNYVGLEPFPLSSDIYQELDTDIHKFHELSCSTDHKINPWFGFRKENCKLEDFSSDLYFDLVYFDAFSPNAQPELWTTEVFKKLGNSLKKGAILSTYCSKVAVQANLRDSNFIIEKHKGPQGKRDVLRAIYQQYV